MWYGFEGGRWLIKVYKYCLIHVINNFRSDTEFSDFLPNAEVSYYHFAETAHQIQHVYCIHLFQLRLLQRRMMHDPCFIACGALL